MRVCRCDRCGKYGTTLSCSLKLEVTGKRMPWFGTEKHFCGECAESFCRWFYDPEAKKEESEGGARC